MASQKVWPNRKGSSTSCGGTPRSSSTDLSWSTSNDYFVSFV